MASIALLMLVVAVNLALTSTCLAGNTVWAASTLPSPTSRTSPSHSGPVIQEQVSTGNPNLDKQISKFYSCISKTHLDPPTVQAVDSCYTQQQISGITGPGTATQNPNKIGTHPIDISPKPNTSNPPEVNPPPGVLVEVP